MRSRRPADQLRRVDLVVALREVRQEAPSAFGRDMPSIRVVRGTRRDREGEHAGAVELRCERLGQVQQARLGAAVGGGERPRCGRGIAGDVHDPPPAAVAHPGQDGARAEERALQRDLDVVPPDVRIGVLERPDGCGHVPALLTSSVGGPSRRSVSAHSAETAARSVTSTRDARSPTSGCLDRRGDEIDVLVLDRARDRDRSAGGAQRLGDRPPDAPSRRR